MSSNTLLCTIINITNLELIMDEKEAEQIVRKVLSEEVSEHRIFLGQQFKQITWGIGILFTVAAALFAYILGKSIDDAEVKVVQTIDDKVFEYRIAKDLKTKVNEHVRIAVANSVENQSTNQQIEGLIKTKTESVVNQVKNDIQNSIRDVVKQQFEENKGLNAEELIKKHIMPSRAVLAFDSNKCPTGWTEYTKAYGRFIRGVDKSGKAIDSDGLRSIGSKQGDSVIKHTHSFSGNSVSKGGNGGTGRDIAVGDGSDFGSYKPTGNISEFGTANETRPKNIALLYCKKI